MVPVAWVGFFPENEEAWAKHGQYQSTKFLRDDPSRSSSCFARPTRGGGADVGDSVGFTSFWWRLAWDDEAPDRKAKPL